MSVITNMETRNSYKDDLQAPTNTRRISAKNNSWLAAYKLFVADDNLYIYTYIYMGRNSPVDITTRYGLDGLQIESRWWARYFRTRPDRLWGPPSLLYNRYQVFLGGKAAGTWHWSPTSSSAEAKERVDLYLYSPSGFSWSVIGWNLTFNFIFFYVYNFFF